MKTFSLTLSLFLCCALLAGSAVAAPFAPSVSRHSLSLLPTAPLAQADIYKHQQGGVQFELPKGWKVEPDGEQITASTPDGSFAVVFWVTSENDFEAASKALGDELDKQLKSVKLDGQGKVDTHNGMKHFSQSGTGTLDGQPIAFSVDLLMAKKPVIVLTFASAENIEKHVEDYMNLVKSIKRIE